MKPADDEVYTHVIETLSGEDLEHLADGGPGAFFDELWKVARVEVELQGRQARECLWVH